MKQYFYPELNRAIFDSEYTLEELADILGIHITTIMRKKGGKNPWTVEEAIKLHEVLDYKGTIQDLFKS